MRLCATVEPGVEAERYHDVKPRAVLLPYSLVCCTDLLSNRAKKLHREPQKRGTTRKPGMMARPSVIGS